MSTLKKNQPMIKLSDKFLFISMFTLSLISILSIPAPLTNLPLNALIQEAIPLPIAIFSLLLPFGMYFGIISHQKYKFEHLLKKEKAKSKKKNQSNIIFRCRYKPQDNGILLELKNVNSYDWTKTVVLVEREYLHEKTTEKIKIGKLVSGKTITFPCKINHEECSQWQILLLCQEGRLLDFLDQWK